jgi:hypothetical protein
VLYVSWKKNVSKLKKNDNLRKKIVENNIPEIAELDYP